MPGCLWGDDQPMLAGKAHCRHDVLRVLGGNDGFGPHLDREVPRCDEGGVVGVTDNGDGSGGDRAQLLVGRVGGQRLSLGHGVLRTGIGADLLVLPNTVTPAP